MHFLTVSFTHKNSTLQIREKLVYNDEAKVQCLQTLNAHPVINESMLISTCNRLEVFCSCSNVFDATEEILRLLSDHSKIGIEELEKRADVFDDEGSIHHLFSVASSLDSLVVGETQIAGQLKDAFRFSHERGYCAAKISRAVQHAFKCAAEVRRVTDISSKPVSVASVAVAKAKNELGTLQNRRALVIGSGEMSVIVAKHLKSGGADVTLMNRTLEKIEAIAHECECNVAKLETLGSAVNDYEVIFTATSASEPIITDAMVKPCEYERYWFDLAVPRDIGEIDAEGVSVFVVDDLNSIVQENIMLREEEAKASYVVVGRYTDEFVSCLKRLSVEPMIKLIYERAYDAARCESRRAVAKGFLPAEYEKQATKMARQSMNRFLHAMTSRMRTLDDQAQTDKMIESFNYLLNSDELI